jgi:uncharacterized protein YbaR (Trm112 family)
MVFGGERACLSRSLTEILVEWMCEHGLDLRATVFYPIAPVPGHRCEDFMAEQPSGKRPVQVDKDLLAILCCPDTKLDVSLADDALISRMNDAVSRGVLKNKAQKPVTELLDGGLIRADRKILYPIREDIPVMLIEEGIPLDQLL